MKTLPARIALLFVGLALAACGRGEAEAPAGDSTTADLLSNPVTDGVSTSVAPAPEAGDGPRVEVAPLGYNHGEADALVKVVELSDFGCGFCKRFHDQTFDVIRDEFIDQGKVEWKFIPYITGMFANSLAATEAGECVMEQSSEAYEAIAKRFWDEQSEWKNSSDPQPVIRGWVSELGVEMDRFDECLDEDRRLDRIASATTLARQVGVRGTPTFVIIGYPPLQGALPTDFFREIFTAVYAEELQRREQRDSEDDVGS
jgi:protein-disulfide isomerase